MDKHGIWRLVRKLGGEGILTVHDMPELGEQRQRVLELMLDGDWHSGPEILEAAGGTEGLRRLRELREIPWIDVERERSKIGNRTFCYKIKIVAEQRKSEPPTDQPWLL